MTTRAALAAVVAVLTSLSLAPRAFAADKKAEGELRWGLNYCTKVVKGMEKARGRADLGTNAMLNELGKWTEDHAKYVDYLAKAKAIDPTVTTSATVYDKKEGLTFGQALERCEKLAAEMADWKRQAEAKEGAKQAQKDAVKKEEASAQTKEAALQAADDAIRNICAQFKGWQGSSGFDESIAQYEKRKKEALAAQPPITAEPLKVDLVANAGEASAPATKTVGEWFKWCDAAIPAHAAAVRAQEKQGAAADQADADKRKAMNNRIRDEEAAKFKKLVAETSGDRKKVLQSKGFGPWWPRNGDLRTAPVWKWEINITHEPVRCESYQFSGDKLTSNTTSLGACP